MMQHRNAAFRVAMLDQWVVIVSGPQLIEDLRKLPADKLSFNEGSDAASDIFFACFPHV